MEATPRFRLFNNRSIAGEEARGAHRRVDSVGRGRRRRPGRGLFPRILSGQPPRRRLLLLVLLVACGTCLFVSFRLLAWASSRPSDGVAGGDVQGRRRRHSSVSLGPDAIPSVVLVERRTDALSDLSGLPRSGGSRKELRQREGDSGDTVAPFGEANGGHIRQQACRNTVQGKVLLADSEGRVCPRTERDVRRPGCCTAKPLPKEGAFPGNAADARAATTIHADDPDSLLAHATTEELGRDERNVGLMALLMALLPTKHVDAAAGRGRGPGGFPPVEALSTPFSCWSCDVGEGGSSCCRSYEFCVSCCQDPRRAEEREVIRAAAARSGHPAYGNYGVNGHENDGANSAGLLVRAEGEEDREERARAFDHCAFRCRTYSGSVAHENSYRGPLKHCFGRFRPPVVPGMSANSDGTRRNEMVDAGGEAMVRRSRGEAPLQVDPLLAGFIGE